MRRQLEGLAAEVDYPSEDELSGAPTAVAFLQLLEGHRFFEDSWGFFRLGDHAIDSPEQVVSQAAHAFVASLADLDEIVDEDVGVAHRALKRLV